MQILKNLNRADYDSIDAFNASRLSLLLKSPRLYQLNQVEETDSMRLGTAIHTAYLEPTKFKQSYVVEPSQVETQERDKNGKVVKDGVKVWQPYNARMKDHKEWMAGWRDAQEKRGAIVLDDKEMGSVTGVLNSIHEEIKFPPPKDCISIQELLATKDVELTAVGEINGRKVKARADLLVNTRLGKTVVDIKKTSAIFSDEFCNKVDKFNYDLQAAFYKAAFGADAFVWLCCGSDAPFMVVPYDADLFLEAGAKKIDKCFETYDRCTAENYWPWHTRGVEKLVPSAWYMKKYGEESTL